MDLFNTPSMRLLERSVEASSLRQRVIANNIANADTPYFKRSYVTFEDALQEAMTPESKLSGARTNSRHIPIGRDRASSDPDIQILADHSKTINNNMNNVDIDYEMAQMAKNNLRYNVLMQKLNGELRSLRTAIEGR